MGVIECKEFRLQVKDSDISKNEMTRKVQTVAKWLDDVKIKKVRQQCDFRYTDLVVVNGFRFRYSFSYN